MTPQEFVKLFYDEKNEYLKECLDENSGGLVSGKIKTLNLSAQQKEILTEAIDAILTDVYYSILLGIDGGASIGGFQQDYKLYDENDVLITDGGKIEGEAWEIFHNRR